MMTKSTIKEIYSNLLDKCHFEKSPGNRDEIYRFETVDFAKIAEEIGCFGIRVESPNQITAALETALASDKPAVVDVVTDIHCEPPIPWKPPSK